MRLVALLKTHFVCRPSLLESWQKERAERKKGLLFVFLFFICEEFFPFFFFDIKKHPQNKKKGNTTTTNNNNGILLKEKKLKSTLLTFVPWKNWNLSRAKRKRTKKRWTTRPRRRTMPCRTACLTWKMRSGNSCNSMRTRQIFSSNWERI